MSAGLILKEGREKSVLRHHPWIFSGAIAGIEADHKLLPGETVSILSARKEFLASAAFSPDSMIRARIWSWNTEAIGRDFFKRRFEDAFLLRKRVFGNTLPDAYRLIDAESDGIPGFIADIYGKYAVCQISSAGAEYHRTLLGELLLEYAPGGVYERSDVDSRKKEGLELRTGDLCGGILPEKLCFSENAILFEADPRTGHKTGFYLDQRIARKFVMDHASFSEEALNCFCYTGGFGLAAAKGGAKHVLNVDSSAPALALARKNAELNHIPESVFETQEADVFQFLRKCRDSRKTFDLIILDPPKFAESASQKEKAARAYKDINLLAIKLLRKGGTLFTFSCSGAMDTDLFGKVVDSAACDANADLRITHLLTQGPDHPVSAAFPEGRYLKGICAVKLG